MKIVVNSSSTSASVLAPKPREIESFSSSPMPPPPTAPMMVEARTLISSAQQRVGHEVRQDLRQGGEAHALEPVGADRPQAFVGPHVDVLDDFVEQLAERADRVQADGDDGGDRADREDRREQAGDDDLRERRAGIP